MEIVGYVLIEIIGYYTAKTILPVVSVGWWRVDHWTSERPGGWLGCYKDGQHLVFTPTMASWIGLLFWLLVLVIIIVATGR